MCPRPLIVCVCTGNTCRSPMAAALLRRALDKRGREDILVESAGLAAGATAPASEYALAAAAEIGLDLSGHLSRPFTPALAAGAARIVAMTAGHAAVLTGRFAVPPERVIVPSGGIPDPFGGTLADYRRTRDTLAAAIGEDSGTIEDVYEPYLIQNGFLNRTPRGRTASEAAYRHLGLPCPEES